jgi:hypothetical protein
MLVIKNVAAKQAKKLTPYTPTIGNKYLSGVSIWLDPSNNQGNPPNAVERKYSTKPHSAANKKQENKGDNLVLRLL